MKMLLTDIRALVTLSLISVSQLAGADKLAVGVEWFTLPDASRPYQTESGSAPRPLSVLLFYPAEADTGTVRWKYLRVAPDPDRLFYSLKFETLPVRCQRPFRFS